MTEAPQGVEGGIYGAEGCEPSIQSGKKKPYHKRRPETTIVSVGTPLRRPHLNYCAAGAIKPPAVRPTAGGYFYPFGFSKYDFAAA